MSIDLYDVFRFRTWYKGTEPDECWLWFGGLDKNGYGKFKISRRHFPAHRYAYLVAKGDFDPSLLVRHTCDTPACVNPNHLVLGTHDDNMKDMIERGRNAGQNVKLTLADVEEIRFLGALGLTGTEIATKKGVSYKHVYDILRGDSWKT